MSKEIRERLFIKKIEIENCGRFYGTGHSILLSDSTEKNITIIIGDSGRGKSTIHDSIYWCLYGEHKRLEDNEKNELDYGLINSDALENLSKGESVTASVTLSLHNEKEEKYLLTRQLKATLNRDSNSRKFEPLNNSRVPSGMDFETSARLVMKNESGDKNIEKNEKIIRNEINKQFPQNLSDFFLFDGEYLVRFRNQASSSKLIQDGITKISGLTIFDSLIENSKVTADKILNYIGGKSASSAPFTEREKRLGNEKNEIDQKIRSLRDQLKKKGILYDEITSKINKNKEGKKIRETEAKAFREKKTAGNELSKNTEEFKEFLFEKIPQLLIRDVLTDSEKTFEKLEDEDKIPPSISRSAIDKILNSHPLKCVCGREFEKNEKEGAPWMELTKIKEAIIEDEISQGISLGRVLISQLIDGTSQQKLSEKFDQFKQIRTDKRRSIQEAEAIIEDCNRQLKDVDFAEEENLAEKKSQLWDEIGVLNGELKSAESDLVDKTDEWDKNHKSLHDALDKEGRYDTEKNKISLGKAISKFSKELRKRIEEILRGQTEKATSKYFLESAPEKQSFDHISISENYDITARDSSNLVASLSKGQAHVLGLSYVAGIREITHTNTFLIIDSPLHNISGIPRNEISEVFSKYLPGVQLVLLVTDTEYLQGDPNGAEPVKNILRTNGRIWKEYIIENATSNGDIENRKIVEYRD